MTVAESGAATTSARRLGGGLPSARRDRGQEAWCVLTGPGDDWLETIGAVAGAGADAIEIGVPFSDPVMDGTIIQQANDRALSEGATPQSILAAVRGASADIGVPTAVMTYVNIAHHMGYERFASSLSGAGVSGCILPDLPLEEVGEWAACADAAGVETVLLAAPTSPDERLRSICARSRGFVYSVGLMGITGVRAELAASATRTAARLKAVTDMPVLAGVGVGTPAQAAEVCEVADGAVVGSASSSGCGAPGPTAWPGSWPSSAPPSTPPTAELPLPPAPFTDTPPYQPPSQ